MVTKNYNPEKRFTDIDGSKIFYKSGNYGIHVEIYITINDKFINIIKIKVGFEE